MSELPWVEKYRPTNIKDIIGNKHIIERFDSFVKLSALPNIILTGPSGVSKTTAAFCLVDKILGENYSHNCLKINASDARCLDITRNTITLFAKKKVSNNRLKIIILDEVDSMTENAQQGLRRIMDNFFESTRFIFICNISNKIIESLQSRCCIFRFNSLEDSEMLKRLKTICILENLSYTEKGLKMAITLSKGDMRIALNNIQSTVAGFKKITYKNILSICNTPRPEKVADIVKHCLVFQFCKACEKINNLFQQGFSTLDIVASFLKIIKNPQLNKIPKKLQLEFCKQVAKTHKQICSGCTSTTQLYGLCAKLSLLSVKI